MELSQVVQLGGMLLGGIGLFLLAVRMITEGLTLAAGETLRDILARWTQTLPRGVLSGMGITGIVQSSSAVTVATIGFVNAGLLNLYQALGVVYGSNIGTTMTGWLVAAVGFKIKVEAFALPLIGLGMLLRLTGAAQRRGAIGEVLAGFGLFFIGIDVLKNAFEGVASNIDLQALAPEGVVAIALFVGVGFVITLLMQSSSAAIAIVLTAASGGVLSLSSAAAMVVGANVGTTSTAALAVIGATPNAKRVASAHIVFNIATGIVALLILPLMLWLVQEVGRTLNMEEHPAVSLALFHTVFNLLGVLLLWPFTRKLTQFLERRFISREEVLGRPQFLDKTVAVSPVLALHALVLEVGHLSTLARELATEAMRWEGKEQGRVAHGADAVEKLNLSIGEFVSRLERSSLPQSVTERLPDLLRSAHYFSTVAELAQLFARNSTVISRVTDETVHAQLVSYRDTVNGLLLAMDPQSEEFHPQLCDEKLSELEQAYQKVKREILEAGAMARIRIAGMSALLEEISRLRRLGEQTIKGTRDLTTILEAEVLATQGAAPAADESSNQEEQTTMGEESSGLTGENGEELSQIIGHDINGDRSENQAEQTVANVQPDRSEETTDRGSEAHPPTAAG